MTEPQNHPFVRHLQELAQREDRGALATLRRGLGQPPGTVASMYPHVVPWLREGASRAEEDAYYTLAALFAYHPQSTDVGDMGHHYARARDPQGDNIALERRFTVLLAAHADDLGDHLRQAIGFLASKEIPINWDRLLRDMLAWSHPDHYVQRRWARAFWRRPAQESDQG